MSEHGAQTRKRGRRCGDSERLKRAVRPLSRSQWNDGYGADTGLFPGDSCRPALRPNLKFKLAHYA